MDKKTTTNSTVRGARANITSFQRVTSVPSRLSATTSRVTTASMLRGASTTQATGTVTSSRSVLRNSSASSSVSTGRITSVRLPVRAAVNARRQEENVVRRTITNRPRNQPLLSLESCPATAPRRSLRTKSTTPKNLQRTETPATPPKSRRRLSSLGPISPGENIFYCPICLEKIKSSGSSHAAIAALMCGHVFCMPCITTSLQLKKVCPICSSVQAIPIEIFL